MASDHQSSESTATSPLAAEKELAGDIEKVEAPEYGEAPDGGLKAWSVVACYFVLAVVSWGTSLFSWSVFLGYYYGANVFPGTSLTLYTLTGGFTLAAGTVAAPFLGALADRFGYRPVVIGGAFLSGISYIIASFAGPGQVWMIVLFQGITNGIGAQASWMVALAAIPTWFTTKTGLAMSVASLGSPIGGFAFSNLTQYLLDRVGLAWTLRTLGFICIGVIGVAALGVSSRIPPQPKKQTFDPKTFKEPVFILCFIGSIVSNFSATLPLFYMTSYGAQLGIDTTTVTWILSFLNLATVVSRFIYGSLNNIVGPLNILIFCNIVAGVISLALWRNATTYGTLLAFALLYGASGAQFTSQLPIVVPSIWGAEDSASKLGVMLASLTFGSIFGNFIGGRILDANTYPNPYSPLGFSQDYTTVQIYTGVIWLISAAIFIAMRLKITGFKLLVTV
ncbi:MFS general substrate transporter [Gonapodya prolifera JEL478]|uniref:MFS general substrate transporter n=1 Tax=Gonapodya prolifera (strain JEL478) TaxID=1344416 RepID=A0A138ZZI5_GONPJ|nr:MFS general substrate transporter [Gonapodya prolifera JEL478]|eukprot:KXS09914.1 MFS general substrate transporter [Gonapodya prolifera JEL478]